MGTFMDFLFLFLFKTVYIEKTQMFEGRVKPYRRIRKPIYQLPRYMKNRPWK